MKKYFIIAAAALATLASCSKVETEVPQEEISFNAYAVKGKTKAPVNSNLFPTGSTDNFTVWANYSETADNWKSGTHYINGTTGGVCAYSSTLDIWESTPKAYWPLSGYLTFAAVYPATAGSWNETLETLTLTDYSASNQDDLMYVNPSSAKNITKETDRKDPQNNETITTTGVNLVFKHALSQVLVNVKAAPDQANVSFKVTALSINAKDGATITVTDAATPSENVGTFTTTLTKAYTVKNQKTNGDATGLEFASAATTSFVNITTGKANEATDAGILVIPQTLVASTESTPSDQYLSVSYEMYMNGVYAGKVDNKKIDLYLAKNTNNSNNAFSAFEAGKKYILDLVFSAEEILYAASVTSWEEETVGDYEVK